MIIERNPPKKKFYMRGKEGSSTQMGARVTVHEYEMMAEIFSKVYKIPIEEVTGYFMVRNMLNHCLGCTELHISSIKLSDLEKFMTVKDAAFIFEKSIRTIQTWCKIGKLKASRVIGSREYLITRESIDELLAIPRVVKTDTDILEGV